MLEQARSARTAARRLRLPDAVRRAPADARRGERLGLLLLRQGLLRRGALRRRHRRARRALPAEDLAALDRRSSTASTAPTAPSPRTRPPSAAAAHPVSASSSSASAPAPEMLAAERAGSLDRGGDAPVRRQRRLLRQRLVRVRRLDPVRRPTARPSSPAWSSSRRSTTPPTCSTATPGWLPSADLRCPVGEDDGLQPVTDAELDQDPGHVGLDGPLGDEEAVADLGVGTGLRPSASARRARGRSARRGAGSPPAPGVGPSSSTTRRVTDGASTAHPRRQPGGVDQVVGRYVLQEEPARSGVQRAVHVVVGVEDGEDDNRVGSRWRPICGPPPARPSAASGCRAAQRRAWCSATSARAWAPSAASPTTSRSGSVLEDQREPAADGVPGRRQAGLGSCDGRPPGQGNLTDEATTLNVRPASRLPPYGHPLPDPDQSVAGTSNSCLLPLPVVDDRDLELVGRPSSQAVLGDVLRAGGACLTVLVSASWTIRYAERSRPAGRARGEPVDRDRRQGGPRGEPGWRGHRAGRGFGSYWNRRFLGACCVQHVEQPTQLRKAVATEPLRWNPAGSGLRGLVHVDVGVEHAPARLGLEQRSRPGSGRRRSCSSRAIRARSWATAARAASSRSRSSTAARAWSALDLAVTRPEPAAETPDASDHEPARQDLVERERRPGAGGGRPRARHARPPRPCRRPRRAGRRTCRGRRPRAGSRTTPVRRARRASGRRTPRRRRPAPPRSGRRRAPQREAACTPPRATACSQRLRVVGASRPAPGRVTKQEQHDEQHEGRARTARGQVHAQKVGPPGIRPHPS